MSGQYLSPSVGGQSLNPPRRLSLGEPLPLQLADIPWALLSPRGLSIPRIYALGCPNALHSVLAAVSSRYSQVRGRLPMYY